MVLLFGSLFIVPESWLVVGFIPEGMEVGSCTATSLSTRPQSGQFARTNGSRKRPFLSVQPPAVGQNDQDNAAQQHDPHQHRIGPPLGQSYADSGGTLFRTPIHER